MERESKKITKKSNHFLFKVIFVTPLMLLGLFYFCMALYFSNTFSYGTIINGKEYTGWNVRSVEQDILSRQNEFALRVYDRDSIFIIEAKDIDLQWDLGKELSDVLRQQNNFLWITGIGKGKQYNVSIRVEYNENKLKEIIMKNLMDYEVYEKPQNAYIEFEEGEYVIVAEKAGNKRNGIKLNETIEKAIKECKDEVKLVDAGCYEMPIINSENKQLNEICNEANLYLGLNIEYEFDIEIRKINKTELSEMLVLNYEILDNGNIDGGVLVSEDKVGEFISKLKSEYDTVNTVRKFVNHEGDIIDVSGGNFGWEINYAKEREWLISNIINRCDAMRSPEYNTQGKKRGENDIGNTYIEVDITKQKMYYYDNARLVLDTDVVTGNVNKGNATPAVVAYIRYKQKDAVLNGENYSTPVEFWMPIYGNIGIHDASWRSEFGGSIYKTNGSHGCINTPYSKAKYIFENVEVGTPVVVHY